MGNELTTSKNIPTGKKVELTPEQKERDKKILEQYNVQIDQFNLEILRLEKAIELNLPEREYKAQINEIKAKIKQFEDLKKVIEERMKNE
jgi:hypothetical protein